MKKYDYSLGGNLMWCDSDYGVVEASNYDEAVVKARDEMTEKFNAINDKLDGFDTICFNAEEISVTEVKEGINSHW